MSFWEKLVWDRKVIWGKITLDRNTIVIKKA